MLQPRRLAAPRDRRPWGLAAAMLGAWTLAAMCNELQVDFEVALFNRAFAARVDDTEWTYSRRRTAAISELRQSHGTAADRLTSTVNHYLFSSFNEPWRRSDDVLAGLFWTAAKTGEAGLEGPPGAQGGAAGVALREGRQRRRVQRHLRRRGA